MERMTQNSEIQHTKAKLGEDLKKKWKNKVMRGQYIINMDRQLISEEERSSGYQKLKVK
jgi:hypothetical protein